MATITGRAAVVHGDVVAGPRGLHRLAETGASEPYRRFDVHPLSPTIGAELAGVHLRDVDDDLEAELRRALLEWKVLFFRDQHLTGTEQRDFAARWGELETHPMLPEGEVPEVVRFEKGEATVGFENIWHSDVTWKAVPPLGAVLRCLDAPAVGGDTLWADMYSAYECLPDDLRERVEPLSAIHDFSASFGKGMDDDELADMQARFPAVEHPVVRTHPETGRKLLYVNEIFTTRIVGLDDAASADLLARLRTQARVPEYQCRFHWTPGSVAFWDNRCTQHYAVSDYWPQARVMERVSILSDDRPH